jgi:membrane protein implicated in regulation of membrane protease activity
VPFLCQQSAAHHRLEVAQRLAAGLIVQPAGPDGPPEICEQIAVIIHPAGDILFAIYLGSLLFGGVLIAASVLAGADHGAELHGGGDAGHGGGDTDHGGDKGQNQGPTWISLFGLRFWSFASTFFGITGLVLRAIGLSALAPLVSGVVGVAAGLGASAAFRRLTGETVGQVRDAGALVGREGTLLLPVARGQRGKVRLAQPGGGDVDLLAESDEALASGTEVLIVEVRGNVAMVARAPAERPAPRA